MKRKLHLLLTLLLLAVCATGGAETYTHVFYTKEITESAGQKTFDNVKWSWTESKYVSYVGSSGLQIGSGNNPAKTWTISTDGIEGTITSVKVKASAAGKATLAVKVGTTDFQYKSNTNITLSSTSTEYEFTGSATDTIAITMKASSKAMYLKSIAVTYSSNKPSAGISFPASSYQTFLGETFTAPKLINPNHLTISYASSDSKVATVDASTGSVTILNAGVTNITASYNDKNSQYNPSTTTASYRLQVIRSPYEIIFSEEGFLDASDVTSVTRDDFTATFSGGSKYYDKGSAVRVYSGNTLTISSTKEITKIEFTFIPNSGSTSYSNLKLNSGQPGTYGNNIWTGSSNSVTFTNKNDQSRILSIKVTFKETSSETYTAATLTGFAQSGNDYYATFSSKEVTFFPESDEKTSFTTDVQKAYALGDILDLTKLTTAKATIDGKEVSGYFVPANTGVLIKASFDGASSIPYYTVSGKEVAELTDNMLYPATMPMTQLTGCYFYKLAYDDYTAKKGLGFYWGAENGTAFTAKTNGAYLAVSKSTSAKSAFRFDGTTTVISAINTENAKTGNAVYNIQGQRVGANYKGLVIVNGKKIIKK